MGPSGHPAVTFAGGTVAKGLSGRIYSFSPSIRPPGRMCSRETPLPVRAVALLPVSADAKFRRTRGLCRAARGGAGLGPSLRTEAPRVGDAGGAAGSGPRGHVQMELTFAFVRQGLEGGGGVVWEAEVSRAGHALV